VPTRQNRRDMNDSERRQREEAGRREANDL